MLAGELSAFDEDRIAAHLEECAACESVAEGLADNGEVRGLLHLHQRRVQSPDAESALASLRERLLRQSESLAGKLGLVAAASADSRGSYGSSTLGGLMAPPPLEPADERPAALGPFQIIKLLGAGSFGFVYEALDTRLGRHVALKLPRANVLADPDLKNRFLREAEALARLDHPNIVPVFEVGEQREAGDRGSTCYLAIALCSGPTLADWLQERGGSVESRLAAKILLPLAEAVAHAHDRQILHRDVKPANILLDRAPASEDLPFTPRLTDFGLAKVAESPSQASLGGLVLGTPQYMAPEQAAGHAERIGPMTDVYSLGAVLYELLTGNPPIVGNSPVDTLRRVLIDEPASVRRANARVPEDLEAIVMKCLDKSPARRYASAADLAADLRRFLAGLPTQARPLGLVERGSRCIQRHRGKFSALALSVAILALSAGIYLYDRQLQASRSAAALAKSKSTRLEQQIETSNRYVADLAYANGIRTAARAVEESDLAQAAAILSLYIPAPDQPDRRDLAWHYLWSRTAHQAQAEIDVGTDVYQLRLSADGTQLAAACQDGLVRIYDAETARLRRTIAAGQGELNGAAFDDAGQRLATAGDDGTVKVWRLADRRELQTIQAVPSHAYAALFCGERDTLLAIGRSPDVGLWQLGSSTSQQLLGHTEAIEALALSPDGRLLATAASDDTAIVWDTTTWQPVHRLARHTGRLSSVAFSPDGSLLATGALDQRVLVHDVKTGEWLGQGSHLDAVQSLTFTSDGQRLVSGDRAGTIRNWRLAPRGSDERLIDLTLDSAEDSWHAHEGKLWSLAPLAEGGFISSGGDGCIRFWGRGKHVATTIPRTDYDRHTAVCASADGKTLYAARLETGVVALDPNTGLEQFSLPILLDGFSALELLEQRGMIAAGTQAGQLVMWDLQTRGLVAFHDLGKGVSIDDLVYSQKADLLAMRCDSDEIWLFAPGSREIVGCLPAESNNALAFSPDGRLIAVDTLNQIAIFDVQTCREVRRFAAHRSTIKGLAWSPDGTLIASGSADRSVRLWAPDGKSMGVLSGHRHVVNAVAFSPDGRVLLSGDQVGSIRLTHVATRRELLTLPTSALYIRQLAMLPCGRRFAFRGLHYDTTIVGSPPPAAASPQDSVTLLRQ
jgi:serine/threonine protein kinase